MHPDWKGNSSQRQHVLWREMTHMFIIEVLTGMVFLDYVLDVRDSQEVMVWQLGMVVIGHGNQGWW